MYIQHDQNKTLWMVCKVKVTLTMYLIFHMIIIIFIKVPSEMSKIDKLRLLFSINLLIYHILSL